MKISIVEATTIPDAWFQCLSKLIDEGSIYTIDNGSFAGQKRLEFDYITIRVKFPSSRPLLPEISPLLGIPNPVAEGYLEEYLPYLMTDIKQEGEDYSYGTYIAPQIPKVISMFKNKGFNTNQAYMSVSSPESIDMESPSCLKGIDCRIKDNKLHFCMYFRSWDCYGGLPANLGGLQLLKEYMCSEIGVEDGEMIISSKGLHIYDYVWDLAKTITNKKQIKAMMG